MYIVYTCCTAPVLQDIAHMLRATMSLCTYSLFNYEFCCTVYYVCCIMLMSCNDIFPMLNVYKCCIMCHCDDLISTVVNDDCSQRVKRTYF